MEDRHTIPRSDRQHPETFPLASLPRQVRERLCPGRYLVCRDRVLHVVDVGAVTFEAVVL